VVRFVREWRDPFRFTTRAAALVDLFAERFPGRADRLTAEDLRPYHGATLALRELFGHYDLIEAYATNPVYPLLADKRPFVAYEHGTLRDIPFAPDAAGRRTALCFTEADAIYMTNADSVAQTRSLQPDAERIIFGVHGFDERRLRRWADALPPEDARARRFGVAADLRLFFAPARHHWREGFDSWLKGNDRVVRAARHLADSYPRRFKVVFVNWGQEVGLTRELIDDLGIGDHVLWIDPLPKRELWHAYCSADCVLDQFVLPCIGGVTIEAMALGRCPVITHLETCVMDAFFGSTPPLYNCRTAEEIASAMETVIANPEAARVVAERGRAWLDAHHSHDLVQRTHVRAYERAGLFEGQTP
jgi:glycosyltransferase involved in cell wall biosynthesis